MLKDRMRFQYLLIALFILPAVSAATLHGTIYNDDLTIASNVLVEINTQPAQRYLSFDGSYEFDVPVGQYTLEVTFAENGNNQTLEENITVMQEGSFRYDLFLFPAIDVEEYDELEELDALTAFPEEEGFAWFQLVGLLILLGLGIGGAIWLPKRHNGRTAGDLAHEVLAVIKREGGRMTQKELRKHLPHSEAKVSLVVAELVAKGKLEKLKKGRGNILVLK